MGTDTNAGMGISIDLTACFTVDRDDEYVAPCGHCRVGQRDRQRPTSRHNTQFPGLTRHDGGAWRYPARSDLGMQIARSDSARMKSTISITAVSVA